MTSECKATITLGAVDDGAIIDDLGTLSVTSMFDTMTSLNFFFI